MGEEDVRDWRNLETTTASELADGSLRLAAMTVPGLTVLCHPDPDRVGEQAALVALRRDGEARLSRLEPELSTPDGDRRGPLADPRLSRRPFVLTPRPGRGLTLDAGATRTRLTVAGGPVDGEREISAEELAAGGADEGGSWPPAFHFQAVDPLEVADVAGGQGEAVGPRRGPDQHVLETDRHATLLEGGEKIPRVTSLLFSQGQDFHAGKDLLREALPEPAALRMTSRAMTKLHDADGRRGQLSASELPQAADDFPSGLLPDQLGKDVGVEQIAGRARPAHASEPTVSSRSPHGPEDPCYQGQAP